MKRFVIHHTTNDMLQIIGIVACLLISTACFTSAMP